MLTILVEKFPTFYTAWFNGKPSVYGQGSTQAEAIGQLIIGYGEDNEVELYFSKEARTR